MKSKFLNKSIFALSLICLLISLKLFWNMGVYVDEFNTSPGIVLGGEFWNYMNWLRLGITALMCVLTGVNIFRK